MALLEIKAFCFLCGGELDTTPGAEARNNGDIAIEVMPCQACMEEAKDEAREAGYRQALRDEA